MNNNWYHYLPLETTGCKPLLHPPLDCHHSLLRTSHYHTFCEATNIISHVTKYWCFYIG